MINGRPLNVKLESSCFEKWKPTNLHIRQAIIYLFINRQVVNFSMHGEILTYSLVLVLFLSSGDVLF